MAAPRLSGEGDNLSVTADHAVWTGTAPEARGDLIEIPLKAGATPQRVDLDDKTVKRIDVIGGTEPRLVVRLHHSKLTTQRTAALTQVSSTSDGSIRVTFPREPGHSHDEDARSEPVPKPAPKIAKAEPALAPAPAPVAKKVEIAAAPMPKIEALAAKAEAPKVAAPVATAFDQKPITFADEPSHGTGRIWSTLLLLVLGGVGVVYTIMKKKAQPVAGQDPFRIVATRTLGGKAKLFMVEVEDKKMLFSVDEKGTNMVGSWDKAKPEAPSEESLRDMAALEAELSSIGFDTPTEDRPQTHPQTSSSPAVAGLLRLRQRQDIPRQIESIDVDDPASETDWAEMLINATRRRGQS